jgi:hypothetical protein
MAFRNLERRSSGVFHMILAYHLSNDKIPIFSISSASEIPNFEYLSSSSQKIMRSYFFSKSMTDLLSVLRGERGLRLILEYSWLDVDRCCG